MTPCKTERVYQRRVEGVQMKEPSCVFIIRKVPSWLKGGLKGWSTDSVSTNSVYESPIRIFFMEGDLDDSVPQETRSNTVSWDTGNLCAKTPRMTFVPVDLNLTVDVFLRTPFLIPFFLNLFPPESPGSLTALSFVPTTRQDTQLNIKGPNSVVPELSGIPDRNWEFRDGRVSRRREWHRPKVENNKNRDPQD